MLYAPDHSSSYPLIRTVGEAAVTVEFGDRLDARNNLAAIAFDAALHQRNLPQIHETAPTNRSVLIRFDPLDLSPSALRDLLRALLDERDWYAAGLPEGRSLWRIPVKYGDEEGPDLADVARLLDQTPDAVIETHTGTRLSVNMVGFSPGLAYCGALPDAWDFARLDYVKPEEPAGAICVAVRQTVIFPVAMPTGWRRIGLTPFRNFNLARDPVFLMEPGDEVQFEPIPKAVFDRLSETVAQGGDCVTREVLS